MEDAEFDAGDSGAADRYPQQASALRKNGHVIIKNRPCKIVEMSTSKTGKHGHAKVRSGCIYCHSPLTPRLELRINCSYNLEVFGYMYLK